MNNIQLNMFDKQTHSAMRNQGYMNLFHRYAGYEYSKQLYNTEFPSPIGRNHYKTHLAMLRANPKVYYYLGSKGLERILNTEE
jgi:hypothetical protein